MLSVTISPLVTVVVSITSLSMTQSALSSGLRERPWAIEQKVATAAINAITQRFIKNIVFNLSRSVASPVG